MSLLIQPARQEDFLSCREQVFERNFLQHGIGSLAEKSQHAILKNYYCPNPAEQEINLGPFVADIANREGVTEIQTALIHMMEIALHEGRDADADVLADRYEELTRQFSFPEWMRYNAHLYLALERKDADGSLSLLAKMLPAMKDAWNAQDHSLYRHWEGESVTWLSGRAADSFCEELQSREEYSFLRAHPQFRELMARFRDGAGA